jgi:hypothetical protein
MAKQKGIRCRASSSSRCTTVSCLASASLLFQQHLHPRVAPLGPAPPPSRSSMSNSNNFSLTIQTLSWAVANNNLLIGNAVVHPHHAARPYCGSATTSLCCSSSPPSTTPNLSPTPVNPRLRHGMGARTGVACSCNGDGSVEAFPKLITHKN